MDLSPQAFPRASLYSGFFEKQESQVLCQQEFLVVVAASSPLRIPRSFRFAYFTIRMRPFESEEEPSVESASFFFFFPPRLGIDLNRASLVWMWEFE